MYMPQMVSVGKAANGFIIEVNVRFKKDAKKTEKMTSCCCVTSEYAGSCEKQYLAKTVREVSELIADIMPLLSQDFKNEDEFDAAFEEATNDMKKGDDNGEKE